jgi:hypothetical protein
VYRVRFLRRIAAAYVSVSVIDDGKSRIIPHDARARGSQLMPWCQYVSVEHKRLGVTPHLVSEARRAPDRGTWTVHSS